MSERSDGSTSEGASFTSGSGAGSAHGWDAATEEPLEEYPIEDDIEPLETAGSDTGTEQPFEGYPIEDDIEPLETTGSDATSEPPLQGEVPPLETAGSEISTQAPSESYPIDEKAAARQHIGHVADEQLSRGRDPAPEAVEQRPREQAWRDRLNLEQLQRQDAYDRTAADNAATLESADPYVSDLARQIDSDEPGSVIYINRELVNPEDHLNSKTEYDIETHKAVIQVKKGMKPEGLGTQITMSESMSDKAVLGYAPDASPGRLAQLRAQGHIVFTDAASLITHLRPL